MHEQVQNKLTSLRRKGRDQNRTDRGFPFHRILGASTVGTAQPRNAVSSPTSEKTLGQELKARPGWNLA